MQEQSGLPPIVPSTGGAPHLLQCRQQFCAIQRNWSSLPASIRNLRGSRDTRAEVEGPTRNASAKWPSRCQVPPPCFHHSGRVAPKKHLEHVPSGGVHFGQTLTLGLSRLFVEMQRSVTSVWLRFPRRPQESLHLHPCWVVRASNSVYTSSSFAPPRHGCRNLSSSKHRMPALSNVLPVHNPGVNRGRVASG